VEVNYLGNASVSDLKTTALSHGTGVVGVAAGVRTVFMREDHFSTRPSRTEGIAPGANVSMFALKTEGEGADEVAVIAEALNAALGDPDLDIINISLQPAAPLITDPDTPRGVVGFWEGDSPTEYFQSGVPNSAKKVFVWAAGNQHRSSDYPCTGEFAGEFGCEGPTLNAAHPSIFAGLPIHFPELRPFWTIVVAVKRDGTISDFSNRCGAAALWCIAAPGQSINVPLSRGDGEDGVARDIETVHGTSFAAPIVSGGLALMKQLFPGMSNIELLERMYETANKDGIYAPDRDPVAGVNGASVNTASSIYGQGLLDLGAATAPVGNMGMVSEAVLSEEVLREASPLSATSLETAGAFGDGIARVFTGAEVAAFDSLGAPFWYPLERFAPRTEVSHIRRQMSGFMKFASAPPSERRANRRDRSVPVSGGAAPAGLETEGQIPSVYFSRGAADMEDRDLLGKEGHLSHITAPEFAGFEIGGFSAYAFTSPEWAERRGHGAVVSWGPLRSGFVSEPDSALGAVAEGAFGELSSELGFAGLGWEWERGGWRFVADAELGASGADTGGGLISGVSRLLTSSFSTGLIRETDGGHAFKLSVSSPLRIEDGRMGFVIPVGRTPERDILRRSLTADLEPSGRQIDVGAQVVAQTGMGRISIGGMASRHPGHDRSAEPALSLLAGYSAKF
ncbi:MAG: S8 family serine peptidase, partial [Candidatus Dadabacteria bacterium]|nr:S8 family serine peptidase [Candidatus Dadabacteria bacterium]